MSKHTALVSLLSLSALAFTAGCGGGGPDGSAAGPSSDTNTTMAAAADAQSFCETYCGRFSACDSRQDADTCATRCANEVERSVERLRADVVASAQECFAASDCREVLSGNRLGECLDEAAVSMAPSEKVNDFCDALDDAATKCDARVTRSKCLAGFKLYSDETLDSATKCTTKSCSQMADCLEAVVGK